VAPHGSLLASFGSLHPGGANFLMGDVASDPFISQTSPRAVYTALGTGWRRVGVSIVSGKFRTTEGVERRLDSFTVSSRKGPSHAPTSHSI